MQHLDSMIDSDIDRCVFFLNLTVGISMSLVNLGLNLHALFINLLCLLLSLGDVVFNDSFAAKYDYTSCKNQIQHSHKNERRLWTNMIK